VKVLVEGKSRARLTRFTDREDYYEAEAVEIDDEAGDPSQSEALLRAVIEQFENYVKLNKKVPPEALSSIPQISDPSKLADSVAAHLSVKIIDKQGLLETIAVPARLEKVYGLMEGEISVLQVEKKIRSRVKRQMEKTQREYYLNEQMKAIQKELEWSRQNAKGGRTKGKARLARLEELQSVDYQKRNETNEIFIPPGERLGNAVMEFKNVSKKFGDRLLFDDLNFLVPGGAIVGIIGPNGAGKSTLFKMITGQEKPDTGEIVVGPTVKLSYVDQSRGALGGSNTVFQEVSGGLDILNINGLEIQSRAYIGRFNFKGQDQQKLVGSLSGGERGRLHMAKTLLQGGNVLLLDEPSNDLDIETLRALEDALLEFPGNTFVISHDRWFLDRIATHILAFEGDSHVEFFQGNYREYEEDKRRRMGDDAAPKRLRFKALK